MVSEKFTIGPKETMDVCVRSRCVRWRYDHTTWTTRVPADHLKVVVNVKDGLPDLDFSLWRSHPTPFNHVPGSREWRSNGPVLPYQGFTLHWFLAREPESTLS